MTSHFLYRRREFIAAIAALLVSPQRLRAQGTPRRIGYLGTRFNAAYWQSFLNALREHGWEDGRNIIVEGRWAEARPERYVELASELADLVVGNQTFGFLKFTQLGNQSDVVGARRAGREDLACRHNRKQPPPGTSRPKRWRVEHRGRTVARLMLIIA
jgi:hypothetical protein